MPITKATASSIAPAAKGDLVVGSATNDAAVLGVGSNDQVLTADSSTATGLKWATAAASVPANAAAEVLTQQTTASTSYVNLTTTGPSVTVTTGTKALVILSAEMSNGDTGQYSYMSFECTGATTINPGDDIALAFKQTNSTTDQRLMASYALVATLTAGSNTFTAKYKASAAGTAVFKNRRIFVINLA